MTKADGATCPPHIQNTVLNSPPSATPATGPQPTQAFDEHTNLVLGDTDETHTTAEVDAETGETIVKTATRQLGMLFVRGDTIILVSPPVRTS